ncbi:MAG: hypothetical protein NC924_07520 [Candidatus Omnitrophica bacterium]|nr:hypothetical protein [Candidatus Omnitrophota bacterium]
MGGIQVLIGNVLLDGSGRRRLDDLVRHLKAVRM